MNNRELGFDKGTRIESIALNILLLQFDVSSKLIDFLLDGIVSLYGSKIDNDRFFPKMCLRDSGAFNLLESWHILPLYTNHARETLRILRL